MNDLNADLDKLEQLARDGMSESSKTGKAALFAAARWLISDLEGEIDEYAPYLDEQVEKLRWSVSAILGFDSTNGHGKQEHLVWVLAALQAIRDGFDRIESD